MKKIFNYFLLSIIFMMTITVFARPHSHSHSHHSSSHHNSGSHHSYNHGTNHHTYGNHTSIPHHSGSSTHNMTKPHNWSKSNPHLSSGYHSTSHGTNNYSQPRTHYYTNPILFFPTTHPYHNCYHHYHVGEHQDTVFCANDKHDEPIFENEESSSESDISGFGIFLIVIGVVAVIGTLAAILS